MTSRTPNSLLIVAHPDDETLWAGGTVLGRPDERWYVITLCRGDAPGRAPRFRKALARLGAHGTMGELDDGPEQRPLPSGMFERTILSLRPASRFSRVLTHGFHGEYTRHRRHEQTARAVASLWGAGRLVAGELLLFAYEDAGGAYPPRPIERASVYTPLEERVWRTKYDIITTTYGFEPSSFEARTTPRAEAFWRLTNSADARVWMAMERWNHESARVV